MWVACRFTGIPAGCQPLSLTSRAQCTHRSRVKQLQSHYILFRFVSLPSRVHQGQSSVVIPLSFSSLPQIAAELRCAKVWRCSHISLIKGSAEHLARYSYTLLQIAHRCLRRNQSEGLLIDPYTLIDREWWDVMFFQNAHHQTCTGLYLLVPSVRRKKKGWKITNIAHLASTIQRFRSANNNRF